MEHHTRTHATRARLIEGAIKSLAEKGFHGTTFVEVCRQTGLSRGAIHHHFNSIPDLMLAVVEQLGHDVRNAVTDELERLHMDEDVLGTTIDLIWEQLNRPGFRAILQLRAAVATEPSLQPAVRPALARVTRWWHEQAIEIIRRAEGQVNRPVIQAVLHALAGAALVDLSQEPPADDPNREVLRTTLKQLARTAAFHSPPV